MMEKRNSGSSLPFLLIKLHILQGKGGMLHEQAGHKQS